MRRLLILGVLFVTITALTPAHQHASYAPAVMPSSMHSVAVATVSPNHLLSAAPASHLRPSHSSVAPEIHPVVHPKPPAHPAPPKPLPPSHGTNPPNSGNSGTSTCNNNAAPGTGSNSQQFSGTNPSAGGCSPVAGVVLPLFGGEAFYLPVAYIPDSTAADQEQGNSQPDTQANDSNAQSDSDRQPSDDQTSASAASQPDSYPPEEPLAEFVFVRRDGSTFNAVGYTFLNDNLRYITDDGLRRSVPLDSLDFDSTRKSNEERGLTINLPTIVSPV